MKSEQLYQLAPKHVVYDSDPERICSLIGQGFRLEGSTLLPAPALDPRVYLSLEVHPCVGCHQMPYAQRSLIKCMYCEPERAIRHNTLERSILEWNATQETP